MLPPHQRAIRDAICRQRLLCDVVLPALALASHQNKGGVLYVCWKYPRRTACTKQQQQQYDDEVVVDGVRYLHLNLCPYQWLQLDDNYNYSENDNENDNPSSFTMCKDVDGIYTTILQAASEMMMRQFQPSSTNSNPPYIVLDGAILLGAAGRSSSSSCCSFSAVQSMLTKLMLSEVTGPILFHNPGLLFPKWQSLSIMELSDANILMEGGEMTLIRRSANGKVMKHVQPFYFDDGNCCLVLGSKNSSLEEDEDGAVIRIEEEREQEEKVPRSRTSKVSEDSYVKKKGAAVVLEHEQNDDDSSVIKQRSLGIISRPNIYIDDDDPEFDDMDEEDPDDDLDI